LIKKNFTERNYLTVRPQKTLGNLMDGHKPIDMKALSSNVAEIKVSYIPTGRPGIQITCSKDAYMELKNWFSEDTMALQEQFVVLYLNRANRVLAVYEVSRGGLTGTVADPRLILSTALKLASVGILVAHNHPSGSLKPSMADKQLTEKIKEGGKLLDIQLLDHIILTSDDYYSFADEGCL
jgi:DNA repair protein RadC